MSDPNYIQPGEPHTCGCEACSEEIARLVGAPENGTPVTMAMGATIGTSYWQFFFPDGTEALVVRSYYTGGADEPPWALHASMRASERTAHCRFPLHRCACGSKKTCVRVTHTPLTIRYAGQSHREHYIEAYRAQGLEI